MQVAHEFQKVRLLLHHDGLVPILKEMAPPPVSTIEGACIPGEERTHHPRQRASPRSDQEMGVIGKQRPGVHRPEVGLREGGDACRKVVPIVIVAKEGLLSDRPHHHVVQGSGCVKSGATWHDREPSTNWLNWQRPPSVPQLGLFQQSARLPLDTSLTPAVFGMPVGWGNAAGPKASWRPECGEGGRISARRPSSPGAHA